MIQISSLFLSFVVCLMITSSVRANETALTGYIDVLPPETSEEREARHKIVTKRREGPVVLVHRGASAFAPENTLEAYAAAMDYGADGCEVDPRRTADGVIVLFHDDMLENLTNGFGSVSDMTYYELLSLKQRHNYGTADENTHIPTLISLLALARQRGMLLHLDFKEPGIAEDVAKILDEADMWDSVVGVNWDNAKSMLSNPKLKLLKEKTSPGLYINRNDVDMEAAKAALAQPGEIVMVDDPRVVVNVLGRPAYQPVAIPERLRKVWKPAHSSHRPDEFVPHEHLSSLAGTLDPNSHSSLIKLLDTSEDGRTDLTGDDVHQQERAALILERAWAAQRIGELGVKTDDAVKLLEFQVANRSLHKDWRYHGMDGSMAIRALGMLNSVNSVDLLGEVVFDVSDDLDQLYVNGSHWPIGSIDWRMKMEAITSLGKLRCSASKTFLKKYVKMNEADACKLGPAMFAEATKSLMNTDVEALLSSPNSEVRGTAILECLDHPSPERTSALKAIVPWALGLPSAQHP